SRSEAQHVNITLTLQHCFSTLLHRNLRFDFPPEKLRRFKRLRLRLSQFHIETAIGELENTYS
ncbi:Hypothetical predicted protein, partial [Paramuricea clavata]